MIIYGLSLLTVLIVGMIVGYCVGYDDGKSDDDILTAEILKKTKGRIDYEKSFDNAIRDIEYAMAQCPYAFDEYMERLNKEYYKEICCKDCANKEMNNKNENYSLEKSVNCWKEIFKDLWE